MHEQKLRIRLIADRGLLIVRRPSKGGWGKKERWKIGVKSYVLRALYHVIQKFVQQRIKRCENKDEFDSMKRSVLRALCEAAEACRCQHEFGREGADCVWYLKDVPLIGFHIHEGRCKKRKVDNLLAGKTVFRWTIELTDTEWFNIRPRETNPKFRFEKPVKSNWLAKRTVV
jgi:hypothetical protein